MITELGNTDQPYPRVTIDVLPDNVLLEIFNFYLVETQAQRRLSNGSPPKDAWHTLVHVCQRWRCIVFASPRRLDLQLLCTNKRPVKKALDIWPALPIVIQSYNRRSRVPGVTNIVAALKQHNRVCEICIKLVPTPLLKKIAAMTEPFPALTTLHLWSGDEDTPVLPDSFLGGSAPRLQDIELFNVAFPALGKLLLSTRDLVDLGLYDVPYSGYISPEVLVTALSGLTRLQALSLAFRSPRSWADRTSRRPPPLTRIVLPALTEFYFQTDSDYLEDIVSHIDTPLLDRVEIVFFTQLLFDTPQLRHFISRTEIFKAPHQAVVDFPFPHIHFKLFRREETIDHMVLLLGISCEDWDAPGQLSSLAQVCNSALLPLPTLESLGFHEQLYASLGLQDDIENTQWLEFLHLFTSVKDLELSGNSVQFIAPTLRELAGERVTGVLPALQSLTLTGSQPSGPIDWQEAIGQFITTRQLSGRPVTVHHVANP
jgi:hypothetical protein